MSFCSWWFRRSFTRSDTERDRGLTTPEDIIRHNNIPYGEDPQWQLLDVYRPRGAGNQPLPVIVSVHGGAWVYGSKEVYQFYCMSLAQQGFAVVNFSYRLAPQHKFPAPLEDTNIVFHWILEHADTYGFDPRCVFAVGDSAGANTLGLFCAACTNLNYAARYPFQLPEGFCPRAVALNCGQYKIVPRPTGMTRLLIPELLPQRGTPEELEAMDVIAQITNHFPPTYVMTSNRDFLKEQAPILSRALESAGVPFVFRCYGSEQNPLGHVFHCNIRSLAAQRCNEEECMFFKSFSSE